MKLKVEYMNTADLKPYANNAKIHTAEQIEQIKKSIQEFGMNDPIAIWKNNEIIEGHGRLIACSELGIDKVPVIRLDGLTDEQRKAYMLVHNKLTMNTGFEWSVLQEELDNIFSVNMGTYGFDEDEEIDVDDYLKDVDDFGDGEIDEVKGRKKDDVDEVYKVRCPYCGAEVEYGA